MELSSFKSQRKKDIYNFFKSFLILFFGMSVYLYFSKTPPMDFKTILFIFIYSIVASIFIIKSNDNKSNELINNTVQQFINGLAIGFLLVILIKSINTDLNTFTSCFIILITIIASILTEFHSTEFHS